MAIMIFSYENKKENAAFAERYPWRMRREIPKQGVVMDIGAGDGSDALAMHGGANGRLLVVAIDPDEANYAKTRATYSHKDIVLCRDWDDVAGVRRNRQIAYLVADIRALPEPPARLKADFIKAATALQDYPPGDHEAVLDRLHALAKPYREVFLRFDPQSPEQIALQHPERLLFNRIRLAGFAVERLADHYKAGELPRQKQHDYMITAVPRPE